MKAHLEVILSSKGTRSFETGEQLIDFLEKRDIARNRARQRYDEEKNKKTEDKNPAGKKNTRENRV